MYKRGLLILSVILPLAATAQIQPDISLIYQHVHTYQQDDDSITRYASVSRKSLPKYPFLIYKKLFSEQISAECVYLPSCSQFYIESVKELGIIKGIFLSADRFTRCTGGAVLEYPLFLHENEKIIDPPSDYNFRNKP